MLYNTHDDIQRETSYIQTATERWIDGALFVSAEDKMTSLDAFRAAGIPTVAIDRIPEGYDGPCVTLDNVKAGRMAAEHLLDLGHTLIAHISGPLRLRLARERELGFRQALAARELAPGPSSGGKGDWGCASGYQAMLSLLDRWPLPTAVFADNDRMAIGAMRAIDDAGLRVPGDISVVGLDDIELAGFQTPPLTTIRQSFGDLATRAVQLLLEIIDNNGQPAQVCIVHEPALVVRQINRPAPMIRHLCFNHLANREVYTWTLSFWRTRVSAWNSPARPAALTGLTAVESGWRVLDRSGRGPVFPPAGAPVGRATQQSGLW